MRLYFKEKKDTTVEYNPVEVINHALRLMEQPSKKLLLDIGCGSGALFLKAMYATGQYFGIGIDPQFFGHARNEGVVLLNGYVQDVFDALPDGVFDVISLLNPEEVINDVGGIFSALLENGTIAKKLKVGGAVIIKAYHYQTYRHVQNLIKKGFPFIEKSKHELRELFNLGDEKLHDFPSPYWEEFYLIWRKTADSSFSSPLNGPLRGEVNSTASPTKVDTDDLFQEDQANIREVGGINLTPDGLPLETRGQGMASSPINFQNLQNFDPATFGGFFPVIFQITPVTNLHHFLGVKNDPVPMEVQESEGGQQLSLAR